MCYTECITITPELAAEGMARELIRRIQNMRKGGQVDNLTEAELQATKNLLKDLGATTIYFALTEYLADHAALYKVPVLDDRIKEFWVMHPAAFPEFSMKTMMAGYRLVDIRTVPPTWDRLIELVRVAKMEEE